MTDIKTAKSLYYLAMRDLVGRRYDRAIELLTQVLAVGPSSAMAYTSRGAAFLQKEMPEAAIADFNRAIAADPEYAKAYHLRGLAREGLGDHCTAIQDVERAIALDPEYGAACDSRANLYFRLGAKDKAREEIERVTHRNIEAIANDSCVWLSRHLYAGTPMASEINR